jgi:hypothetical protein
MYLDFEENHPDTPRFPAALTRLEAALITALFYAVMFIAYLLAPKAWFEPAQVVPADVLAQEKPPIRFVEVAPLKDVPAPPKPNVVQSDLDRRAMTREKAPKPENTAPFSAGITPEKIEGGPQPEKNCRAAVSITHAATTGHAATAAATRGDDEGADQRRSANTARGCRQPRRFAP